MPYVRYIDVTAPTDTVRKLLDQETGQIIDGNPIKSRCGDAFRPCQDGDSCNHEESK